MDFLHAGIFSSISAANRSGSRFLAGIYGSHVRFRCVRSRHPESPGLAPRYSRIPLWANSAFAASCSWQRSESVAAHRDTASRDTPGVSLGILQDACNGTCRNKYLPPDTLAAFWKWSEGVRSTRRTVCHETS